MATTNIGRIARRVLLERHTLPFRVRTMVVRSRMFVEVSTSSSPSSSVSVGVRTPSLERSLFVMYCSTSWRSSSSPPSLPVVPSSAMRKAE